MSSDHASDVKREAESRPKPQPKWGVLRFMNIVVSGVFISTTVFVFLNYKQLSAKQSSGSATPITNIFYPTLVIWSMCLVYFFGFFGISFLDTDSIARAPGDYGLDKVQEKADTELSERKAKSALKKSGSKSVSFDSLETAAAAAAAAASDAGSSTTSSVIDKLAPRNDTLICAEKGCVVPSSPTRGVSAAASSSSSSTAPPALTVPEADVDSLDFSAMSNEEVLGHLISGSLKDYQLEKKLGDYERAVDLRRQLYEHVLGRKLEQIPYAGYDYNKVFGANCEIVIGYVPLPVGIVGPLLLNGEPVYVPMATTEGCLVASTNRGCKAITASGGCFSVVLKDAITRAPCLKFPSAMRAAALKRWIEVPENYAVVEAAFNSTTNYGRLESCEATIAGRNVFLRFCCMAGDAMGMNMVSKGCLKAIEVLEQSFPDMTLVAISGNMCTDKKPSAINWILGRGKSVVVEAVIPEKIVKSVLKCTVHDMIETNKQKNHIGSAMAGSVGGFNAHAANIVTAVFLATGQDPAQNVESSNCITIMDFAEDGKSLQISVTMPSIEVGTVGGGTHLPAQANCLEILGVRGASKVQAGDNARQLAQIVGASVLAGELSLMAALAANHLVRSHMQHNRKPQTESVEDKRAHLRKNMSMPALSNTSSSSTSSSSATTTTAAAAAGGSHE